MVELSSRSAPAAVTELLADAMLNAVRVCVWVVVVMGPYSRLSPAAVTLLLAGASLNAVQVSVCTSGPRLKQKLSVS